MKEEIRPIDFHVHTNVSDGTMTPTQVVQWGKEIGLAAMAITDHDTTEGLDEALTEGERLGITIIPGIEMSTRVEGCEVHLIALMVEKENQQLLDCLQRAREARSLRNRQMVKNLQEAGFPITYEEVFQGRQEQVITRGNIAEVLVKKGLAGDVREAISRYLRRGCVGYVQRQVPEPEECIRVLHGADALIFVAHLHQIDPRSPQHSIDISKKLIGMGVDGIETRHSEFDDQWRGIAEKIVEETGCLRSGGSDFHGALKKGLFLGTGYGDLFVPETYWVEMQKKKKQEG